MRVAIAPPHPEASPIENLEDHHKSCRWCLDPTFPGKRFLLDVALLLSFELQFYGEGNDREGGADAAFAPPSPLHGDQKT